MAIAITHNKVATLPDQPGVEINKAEWNADHTLAGLGTGVETALAVNVGSAGSVIVNGGALGTPSSGNLSSCTGYPASTPAYPLTITGGVSGALVYANSTTQLSMSALLTANGVVIGGGAGAAPSTPANNTLVGNILTLGASAVGGLNATLINDFSTGTSVLKFFAVAGTGASSTMFFNSSGRQSFRSDGFLAWSSSASDASSTLDAGISRGGANQVVFGAGTASGGTLTSRAEINKAVTGIADATPTALLTFTVPNGPHSASFMVEEVGTMGAGGVGANESTQTAQYRVDIARIAGANAVATISAAFPQAAAASVATANSIAVTGALSAISGAVGTTNTFTFNGTLTKSGGAAANHSAMVHARLLNANASGVTVA